MGIVKAKRKNKKVGDWITELFVSIVLIATVIACIYPFWHVLMYSFSDSRKAMSGGVFLFPRGFSTATYEMLFMTEKIFVVFKNSVLKALLGTGLAMVVTSLTAYVLAQEVLKGKRVFLFMIYFTMLFGGGTIPNYLLMRDLHLLDTFAVYVIPGAMSAYNMFVLRNAFASIPNELPESAVMDGANPVQILLHIHLPLCKAALATIALYYVRGFWNSYMDGVLYTNDSKLMLLQVYLRQLISLTSASTAIGGASGLGTNSTVSEESMKMTVIAISIIPIILVYVFLQRFFQKGVNVGAVKG